MAIKSNAFGRVTLTKEDAAKFERQIKYGRPSQAARAAMARGRAMNADFKNSKPVTVSIKRG